ncbi:MAG: hypothetical protein Q9218_005391 [Villophora microphyllina]
MDQFESPNDFHEPTVRKDIQLPTIRTSFSGRHSQLRRPRRTQTQPQETSHHHEHRAAEQPSVKRQASRGRLLGIFGRTKSTRDGETAIEQGLQGGTKTLNRPGASTSAARGEPYDQETDASIATVSITAGEVYRSRSSKATRSKSFKTVPSTTKSVPWDPPPLFQAYPQSVKHATLSAPAMSSDSILGFQYERKRKPKGKKNGFGSAGKSSSGDEEEGVEDGQEAVLAIEGWSSKIYLLVTSGYMLQYSGEGSFDRLPEKIMPIGKDSAAFASDAIPGKHWVLQVSHVLDENGIAKTGTSWSFLRRLGLVGNMKRCSASNFLLVLDSPQDLDAWLSVVRREIEAWGGDRYQADTSNQPSTKEVLRPLQQKPSRRYLVKRDPNQFSASTSNPIATADDAMCDPMPVVTARKSSTTTQDSVRSPSLSNATGSTDQYTLDRLRNSPRMSYISTSARTYATSRDPSPVLVPPKPVSQTEDSSAGIEHIQATVTSSTAAGCPSSQYSSPHLLGRSCSSTPTHPASTVRSSPAQTQPVGATNFSVPSFSKRYSSAHSTPPLSTASSSSASNLPRKSASPATIDEQHDDYDDIAAAVDDSLNQDYTTREFASAYSVDRDSPHTLEKADSATSPPILRAQSLERPVPRRFSSLEYSRGISPVNFNTNTKRAPHPPPTSALPALPESRGDDLSTPARTLRRPVSMVDPSHGISDSPHMPLGLPGPVTGAIGAVLAPPARAPPPPPGALQSLSSQGLSPPTKAMNRRSMPHLSRSPYDPPDCPLPTPPVPRLPPIKLSSGSLRRSVERPLRAGLGPRTPGLVEGTET